ncbi:MAG: hypothetical protein DMF80_23415 [Acidobacteria bacterium]|nr:MAG: hypothetical protein DMF80_23415 [Acidobacteriota bacterium]
MPQVTVGLEKWLEGQTTRPSILTRIHPLDLPDKQPARPRTMMISAGHNPGVSVDLPVGRYLFEAYLPSGEIATETATIIAGANKPVVLRATDSPHEWLSWQHLATQAPARPPAPTDMVAQPVPLDVVTGAEPPAALPKALVGVWKGASPEKLLWTPLNVPARPGSAQPMVDGRLSVTSYLFEQGPWHDGGRYYGLMRQAPAGSPLLAVLPLPWRQADLTGPGLVDVVVDAHETRAKGRREWPVRISVVVRDNVMASVFGYLAAGDLPTAARVTETAVDMLYQKVENPLAAAGGAYVLVQQPIDPAHPPIWVPWLQNLRNWFEWLPDGAILDGWAHLNGIGRSANVKEASAAFVAAVERGVPFYSAGARLLFEGLTRVDAAGEAARPPGFADAFDFARGLALRVDVRQPFTVVRLG